MFNLTYSIKTFNFSIFIIFIILSYFTKYGNGQNFTCTILRTGCSGNLTCMFIIFFFKNII